MSELSDTQIINRREREQKENERSRQQHARVRQTDPAVKAIDNSWSFGRQNFTQYLRHLVQLTVLLVLHGRFLGLKETGLIVPFLHAAQAPWSTALGAYESLEFSISQGIFPLLVLGVIFFTAVTVGRLLCGWACPFGLIQDLLSYLPFRKRRDVAKDSEYKDVKYIVLGASILLAVLFGYRRIQAYNEGLTDEEIDELNDGASFATFFSVLNPDGTLFAYLPWIGLENSENVLYAAGAAGWLKLSILIAMIAACMYTPRFFCRYVCPMGASLGLLSRFKLLKIKTSGKLQREPFNKTLAAVCPMGVQQDSSSFIDSPLCVNCGKCVSAYPKALHHELY